MTLIGHAMVVASLKAAAGGNVGAVGAMVLNLVSNHYPRSTVAVPAPIMIRRMGNAYRIEALGLGSFDIDNLTWCAFRDALATVLNRQIRNNETGRYLWRQTTTRARVAHGEIGRQPLTEKAKAGGVESTTGLHLTRAQISANKEYGNEG